MLTLEDCIALCGLTKEEVDAIALHEHIPEIAATEMAEYLVHSDDGCLRIRAMIRDDIDAAEKRGDATEVLRLRGVLRHFIAHHLATAGGERQQQGTGGPA